MTTTIDRRRSPRGPVPNALTSGRLPRFFELYALIASLLVCGLVLAMIGFNLVGWLVLSAIVYLLGVGVLSTVVENRRKATDRLVRGLVVIAFLLAMIPLVSALLTVVGKGLPSMTWDFISRSSGTIFDPKTLKVTVVQGAVQSIVGTLIITGIAALISIPIGIMTAIYLVEYATPRSWMARTITFLVDVMTGIPSIVAGLFAYSLFALFFGAGVQMAFGGSVALALLMIPIVVRSTEEMLKLVPEHLREASYALGVPKWRTILKIVLPTASSGIITGVTLAIARVIGETAPLLIIAGATASTNWNLFGSQTPTETLPVFIYSQYSSPGLFPQFAIDRAWGAALVLIILVLALNLLARVLGRIFAPKKGH